VEGSEAPAHGLVQAVAQVQVPMPAFAQSTLHVPAAHPESEQLPVFAHESAHPSPHVETQFPVVPAAQSIAQPPPSQEKTQFDCAPRHRMVQPPPGQS
jgi:hypothetical protein